MKRLASIDALRGFDMWFITGGATLVTAVLTAFGAKGCWLYSQMFHVPWYGFHHHDTIFPLFMFLAGVSWPFSLESQREKGRSAWQIHRKILTRGLLLFLFGFLYQNAGITFNPSFRLMGVLNFIGICWAVSAFVYLHLGKLRSRILFAAALLIGYWALLTFCIAPDAPAMADSYSMEWNIASYLDRTIWPSHLYKPGVYEPESFFSIPGGIALCFTGMLAGSVLKEGALAPGRKTAVLFGGSVLSLALTFLFTEALSCPIVKALWSPSFVFAAATYAFAMLGAFYWIIDVKGWNGWTYYFRIIGMNSITIYLVQRIVGIRSTSVFFFGGLAKLCPEAWAPVMSAFGYLVVCGALLWFLDKRKIYLKV